MKPADRLPSPALRTAALAALLAATALAQAGCRGCGKQEQPAAQAPTAPAAEAVQPAAAPSPVAPAEAPTPVEPPPYPGPRSESPEGYRITTGFAGIDDAPRSEPQALEKNKVYVTVLDPDGRPLGRFDKLERGDLHGFLVARDLRQAFWSAADGPVREGADARQLAFEPREGGDHALVVVFKPVGGAPRTVSTPVSIKGALPEVLGPGVEGQGSTATAGSDRVHLGTVPAQPVAGQPVLLQAHDLDPAGAQRGEVRLPFAVVVNDQMGYGDVVEWDADGKALWRPARPGTYLVLAPPTRGEKALTFKLVVAPPPAAP